jgi:hypothetical protein
MPDGKVRLARIVDQEFCMLSLQLESEKETGQEYPPRLNIAIQQATTKSRHDAEDIAPQLPVMRLRPAQ